MSGGSHFNPRGEHRQQHRPRCGGPPWVQQQRQRTGPRQMRGLFQILNGRMKVSEKELKIYSRLL